MKSRKRSSRKAKGGTIWSTEVPYDTQFHGDLVQKDMKKHINDIKDVILPRLQDDINTEIEENKIKLAKNNERQTKIEEVNLRNSALYSQINSKWNMFLFSGIFAFFKYALSAIGALLYILIFVVLGQIVLVILAAVKIILSNPVIVGAILLVISIILILQFVFGYLVPLPGFVSKKPPENKLEGQKLAESKIEYEYDFITSIQDFFLSIPQWFDNAFVNMKRLYQKLAKFFGNNSGLDMYMKDREEYYEGRWDNTINMELGKLVQDFENITTQDNTYIYSLIKPKDLQLNLTDLKSDDSIKLDMKSLPETLYKDIQSNMDVLNFKWDMQNVNDGEAVQYIMSCDSYDKNNNMVKLYTTDPQVNTECTPIKLPYKHENIEGSGLKYYDINVVRGDKALSKDEYIQIT